MPAEAWLLDNFYLIEQQIALARRHLPRGYSRQLPRLADGPSAGFPRIYDLALELISHQDGRVDRRQRRRVPRRLPDRRAAEPGGVVGLPDHAAAGVARERPPRRRCASRAGARSGTRPSPGQTACSRRPRREPKQLIHVLAEFADADVPLTAPFVEDFYARLQAQGPALAFVQTWLEHQLSDQGVSAVAAVWRPPAGRPRPTRSPSPTAWAACASSRRNGLGEVRRGAEPRGADACASIRRGSTPARISPPATATGTPSRP